VASSVTRPSRTWCRLPELLKEAVEREGYTLVHGGLNGLGPSGLSYDVEFESTRPDFPADAHDKVAAAILEVFRSNDISFAYPTQVNLLAKKSSWRRLRSRRRRSDRGRPVSRLHSSCGADARKLAWALAPDRSKALDQVISMSNY
jgi:hypothetical protein